MLPSTQMTCPVMYRRRAAEESQHRRLFNRVGDPAQRFGDGVEGSPRP